MKCHDCESPAKEALIVGMVRIGLCSTCHRRRVAPPGIRRLSESEMLDDLRPVVDGKDRELLEIFDGLRATPWEAALIRSSLRAVWIERGLGRAG